jgi:hypothetical protein
MRVNEEAAGQVGFVGTSISHSEAQRAERQVSNIP